MTINRSRTVKALLLAAALPVGLLAATATPAHANWPPEGPFYVQGTGGIGVADRNGPWQWATTGSYGVPEGAAVYLICWSYGDRVGANGNSLWWMTNGSPNWVADHWLSTPVPNGLPTITGPCPGADLDPN
jgi:hypothetical protein